MGQDSGGLPHYTAELANAVAEHAEVTVLKPSETTGDELFNGSVRVVNAFEPTEISMQNIFDFNFSVIKNVRGILSYRNIELVEELDPDVVHDPTDEFPQVSLFSYSSKVYEDRPYLVTKHEVKHGGASRILRVADFVMSLVPDFAKDAAVVHSDRQREDLAEQERNFDAVEVIPHGVYSFFTEFDHPEPPEEENHALFFGSLIPPKGVEVLLQAVPLVVEELPDFHLTIAGDGELSGTSEQIVADYGEHVTVRNDFVPNEEVGELFERAQLVVLPYRDGWQTGHSGTLSTAFAYEKPVITSAVGDFPELVDDSGGGRTVEPEDPPALADAIVDVLGNRELRESMSEASGAVADRLSWENVGQQHVELYERLLDER